MGNGDTTDNANMGLIEQLVKLRIKHGNSDCESGVEITNQTLNPSTRDKDQDNQDPEEVHFKKALAESVVDRCILLGGHGKNEKKAIAEIEEEYGCKFDYFEKEYHEARPDYETLMDCDELKESGVSVAKGDDCGFHDLFGDVFGEIFANGSCDPPPRRLTKVPRISRKIR